MTPLKAIRAKCLDCCIGQAQEVRMCPSQDCPLWDYRMGHNPARQGHGGKGFSPKNHNSLNENGAEEEENAVHQTD